MAFSLHNRQDTDVPGIVDSQNTFTIVTERGGELGSQNQIDRAYHRYRFAASFCEGKDVLEIACGVGQGLGLLSKTARSVVGTDIDENNLAQARETYKGRDSIKTMGGDAHSLPLESNSFDVILLFEAIYYLANPQQFVAEAKRLLRPGGTLLLCTANKDLPDFNRSPLSHTYYNPPELVALLEANGFSVKCLASDPVGPSTIKTSILRTAKKTAVQFGLIPKTMRGKAFIKRLVFGKLVRLPRELSEQLAQPFQPPKPISSHVPDRQHRVIYAVATL